jgi:lipopolysaccharide/colanic/teichoic acid biosynthesis glycosyltransferase
VKRLVDLAVVSVGLVVLSPLMVLLAALIAVSMGWPIIFRQVRAGYLGRPFVLYKFRTMRPSCEGETWFRTDAQRLTPLGRFLRRTSLDELPEILNVLKGDMSVVGPRPLLMEYLSKYTEEQGRRHEVLPGITGWAQVHGRQLIPFSRRLELDLWYVDHWSLALDLKIMIMTILNVLFGTGIVSGQNVDQIDDIGLSSSEKPGPSQERKT